MTSVESLAASDATCIVCMECIPVLHQTIRACGHMLCATCDTSWRARGQIQEVKMKEVDVPNVCSVFLTVSGCPYCRRMDDPTDYKNRSKDSLFREIQFLTQTLYLYRIKTPLMCTQPIALDAFEPIAPVAAPVASVAAVAPRQVMLFPSTGRCSRRQYGCTTVRTKIRCNSCNQLLCRSCRGLCSCRLL